MLTYKQSIEQKILEAFLLLNNKDCYSDRRIRTAPQPIARLPRLSYIATLFMNRGGAQPPMAKVGIEPTLMSDFFITYASLLFQ